MATTPSDPIVILSYARTPMGSFQGALSALSATELGATAVKAAVERAGLTGEDVDKVFMGNVLSGGLGQAPARQAAIGAGLPQHAEAVTINKVCGSGMQAAIFAHDMLNSGSADVIVAGGMESMTNAPFLLKKHRAGARIGHDTVYDHMMLDEVAAVIAPSFLNAGFSPGILSSLALNGCSSNLTSVSPLLPGSATGAISQSKLPSSLAFFARSVEEIAKRSIASRVNWYCLAVSSAKEPISRPGS